MKNILAYLIKKVFVNTLFLCSVISTFPQVTNSNDLSNVFTEKQLQEDFNILKSELETKHPGLYTYATKNQMDSVFVVLQNSISSVSTGIEFYRKLAILNGVIRDVHTKTISPESFRVARDKTLPRFPFAVHVENDRVFVLRNLSNEKEIAPGWEILKINGEFVEDLVPEILDSQSRDGFNKTGPLAKLNLYFSGLYATVKGCPDLFMIEFKDLQGKDMKLKVDALLHDAVISNYERKYGKPPMVNVKPISYEIKKGMAVLKVASFGGSVIKEAGQSYKKEFKKLFEEIKNNKVEKLIIDLRDNRGGWDEVGDELLAYLVAVSFLRRKSDVSLINTIENKSYYLQNGYIKHFEKLKFKKNNSGYEVMWNDKPTKPKKNLFKGTLLVLINGISASQTGLLAGTLKDKTNAIFIGEETGGNAKEVCGGDIITLTLPNSKVQVEIPIRKLISNINFENMGHGIVPDYMIRPTLNDKISGGDNVLDFGANLIEQKERLNER